MNCFDLTSHLLILKIFCRIVVFDAATRYNLGIGFICRVAIFYSRIEVRP